MLEGEFTLAGVTWISFAEHSVTVAGHNLARLKCLPDEVLDLVLIGDSISEFALHFLEPHEHFLVSQAVQWSGEAVQTGSERQIGIAQSGSDEMNGVSADIAAFVITERFRE